MLAITIRQPWVWAIMHLGKRVENRNSPDPWRKAVGQRIYLHASSWRGSKVAMYSEYLAMVKCAESAEAVQSSAWPGIEWLDYGGIVGSCVLDAVLMPPPSNASKLSVECGPWARGPWAFGPWCLVLSDVRPEPFRACKGALGLWEPSGLGDPPC